MVLTHRVKGKNERGADVLLEEVNVPEGLGDEGAYMEIVRTGGAIGMAGRGELRYFEQDRHMPRTDRYYHRPLTSTEMLAITAFFKAHPLSSLAPRQAAASTRPAASGREGISILGPAPESAAENGGGLPPGAGEAAAQTQTNGSDGESGGTPLVAAGADVPIRLTEFAGSAAARRSEFPSPEAGELPAADLMKLMTGLRDAGETADPGEPAKGDGGVGLTCTYVQAIPPTATLIYADPFRRVEKVWANGTDVRAVISPRSGTEGTATAETAPAREQWLALKQGQWVRSTEPPSATQPEPGTPAIQRLPEAQIPLLPPPPPAPPPRAAEQRVQNLSANGGIVPPDINAPGAAPAQTQPTTAPATAETSPFSNPNLLSQVETWTATPHGTFTAVDHYKPMTALQSQQIEFWVPTFVFDNDHMWVDSAHRLLYLIYDGQLFSLPIPQTAMMER